MKRHRINGLFVSKDHQHKCRKACTLWKLACSSYPCFTLGITRNLVIELSPPHPPPASLCSPREPVLLLCTGPLLKPEEVKKKKKMQKKGFAVQSGVFKQIPECHRHLPWVEIRHVLQKKDGGRLTCASLFQPKALNQKASTTDSRSPAREIDEWVQKKKVRYKWTAQPLCKTWPFLTEPVLVFADMKWKVEGHCPLASLAHCNWFSCCFEQGPKRLLEVESMRIFFLNLCESFEGKTTAS